jgi:hypothetical protein
MLEIGNQHLDIPGINFRHGFIAALVTGCVTGFAAVEMILSALLAKELSRRGDLESLRDRLLRLLLHR